MTVIKICGLKTLREAEAAVEAGADYLGFNFYPKSVRFITPQACRDIARALRQRYSHIRLVGVFVDAPVEEIQACLQACSLDLAQLHGNESPQALVRLKSRAYKAVRGIPADLDRFARPEAPALLVDSAVQGLYGGTGLRADWQAAADLAKRLPIFLAGGLNSENAAEAVRQVRPWGVDAASGLESEPGVKDAGKMKAFVQAVRSVPDSIERLAGKPAWQKGSLE